MSEKYVKCKNSLYVSPSNTIVLAMETTSTDYKGNFIGTLISKHCNISSKSAPRSPGNVFHDWLTEAFNEKVTLKNFDHYFKLVKNE
jgi:hypothetical protein